MSPWMFRMFPKYQKCLYGSAYYVVTPKDKLCYTRSRLPISIGPRSFLEFSTAVVCHEWRRQGGICLDRLIYLFDSFFNLSSYYSQCANATPVWVNETNPAISSRSILFSFFFFFLFTRHTYVTVAIVYVACGIGD